MLPAMVGQEADASGAGGSEREREGPVRPVPEQMVRRGNEWGAAREENEEGGEMRMGATSAADQWLRGLSTHSSV